MPDTLVSDYSDSRVLPGFQHARDGFHVIYELGERKSGYDRFMWRMRHPQGQVEHAHVDIQIRSANKPPVAINGSVSLVEDTVQEITLQGSDIDDSVKPEFYVTTPPANGFLYQCQSVPGSSRCGLGEKITRANQSYPQWASIQVDPNGALDGALIPIYRFKDPLGTGETEKIRIDMTASTVLQGGYGFKTYDFNPERPDNFRRLCGKRGTVAARLLLREPVFVSKVEILYPIRYDTPYRIIAKRMQATPNTTYDYNIDDNGQIQTLQPVDTDVKETGLLISSLAGASSGPAYTQSGEQSLSKTSIANRMSCDKTGSITTCLRTWDEVRYVLGEIRTGYTQEPAEEWTELYRGLPHQSYMGRAGKGKIKPIFPPSDKQIIELRLEACGQEGRVFDTEPPNFMRYLRDVRVFGTRTNRPNGLVTDAQKRLVYVPNPNFFGNDMLTFMVGDLSGGSNRSDARFSQAQGWSPPAFVTISVSAAPDKPLGTNAIASAPPADGVTTVQVSVRGTHPGNATNPVSVFDVHIVKFPDTGELFAASGAPAGAVIAGDISGFVRYRPPPYVCGFRYATFQYRLVNTGRGDGVFSDVYTSTVDVRCNPGYECDERINVCVSCEPGTYNPISGIRNLCKVCRPGEYQALPAQTSCSQCDPGTYADRFGQKTCRLCPTGTASAIRGTVHCKQCEGGTYASVPGTIRCVPCGTLSYTIGTGAYKCNECPTNARANVNKASDILNCTCIAGAYDVQGRTGIECRMCPLGAHCYGGTFPPVPRTGYWTLRSLWTEDTVTYVGNTTVVQSVERGQAFFAPCSYRYLRGVCLGYPDVNVQEREEVCLYRNSEVVQGPRVLDQFTSAGIDVNISECTVWSPETYPKEGVLRPYLNKQNYTANFYCAAGYRGIICSACDVGWRRTLEGYCYPCGFLYGIPLVGTAWFLAVILVQIIFWAVMFYAISYHARSLYLVAAHCQLLAVLGRFSVPWPVITQNMLNGFDLMNLSIDGIHWNCMGIEMEPFWQRWFGELVLSPAILLGFHMYHRWAVGDAKDVMDRAERRQKEIERQLNANKKKVLLVDDEPDGVGGDSGLEGAAEREVIGEDDDSSAGSHVLDLDERPEKDRDHRTPLTEAELKKLADRDVWIMIMLANVLFIQAGTVALAPFSCTELASGFTFLNPHPQFLCNTPAHDRMWYAGFVYGAIVFGALPGALLYTLYKAWVNELVTDKLFRQRMGWLFDPYEIKYFWWEATEILRKAVLLFAQGTLKNNAGFQLLFAIGFLALHLLATAYFRPYKKYRHNVLALWLQAQLLLLACYALTNIVGKKGMAIITTDQGSINNSTRIEVPAPEPFMEAIADQYINSSVIANFVYVIVIGLSFATAFFMVMFDLYEMKLSAPHWAPYLFNTVLGAPLYEWDETVSRVLARVDLFITRVKDRRKVAPPARPSSRWAHRAFQSQEVLPADRFSGKRSVAEMLQEVAARTQEQEWSRDPESIRQYMRSLDKRIFASEMYNSKSSNLHSLERERNEAKKRLLLYEQEQVGNVFKALYDQTGRNEQLIWDMQEIERKQQHAQVVKTGQTEHEKFLEREREEQARRVGDPKEWQKAYLAEKKHCEELSRYVKQARDALVLYNLEESGSSEDEKELDDYLQSEITNYIENKTAKQLMDEGKIAPMSLLS
mmetsp:Transcript_17005/g.41491  ORF Transcript_17005/g.41491 Transcript_17005/m.41491 type:complete len:1661 (-) Transcript_17005:73-5055(-)